MKSSALKIYPNFPAETLHFTPISFQVLTMAPGLGQLTIIPFVVAAYDKTKSQMAFYDSSRHEDFLFISGSKMRALARDGEEPPPGFMAPSAWEIMSSFYKNKAKMQS